MWGEKNCDGIRVRPWVVFKKADFVISTKKATV